MPSVEDYRGRLATLQGAWDTLSMLSHLGGDGTDMGATRQAFESLATDLIRNLGDETFRKSLLAIKAKSQIAIDVMVRNLYERTADIGFLCTDEDIRDYLGKRAEFERPGAEKLATQARSRLRSRFREYVAKYSVYHDVVLLATDGTVLLRLDESETLARSGDQLIAETLATRSGYVETFRKVDLLPQRERSLIYSYRVGEASQPLGVLCLCFRLEDEVAAIFAKLQEESDWTVFGYLTEQGQVIASSDGWQLPMGAVVPLALDEGGRIVRFAGREYLAITRRTQGYQGYMGPGWYGHAMVPLEHAFQPKDAANGSAIPEALLAGLHGSAAIFSEALRRIPQQAEQIQRELNRTIWNGNVRLATREDSNRNFAKTLLWEIGNAGRRTQETFRKSIGDLQETVISSILQDAEVLASLSADVLDRNLYERANDCRWWALNATLIDALSGKAGALEQGSAVLRHINSLYTVYRNIVLFDAQRRVVAVSNASQQSLVGKILNESWSAQTLALRGAQDFAASAFVPSALYDNQNTLVFGAAVRDSAGRPLGGIGIVFDSTPQLTAMLQDALPRTEAGDIAAGCIGMFVDKDMRVLSATSGYRPGDRLELARDVLGADRSRHARIVTLGETCYAIGVGHSSGYREYKGANCIGVVLIPLGPAAAALQTEQRRSRAGTQRRATNDEPVVDIATFFSAGQWLGLPREYVIEAVDGSQLRAMPGSPPWHAGLLMYRDQPITVIDLARLMNGTAMTRGKDVIVVGISGSAQRVGLLIDELAEIPEILARSILPVNEIAMRAGPALVDRAVRPERSDDPVLFILNTEQILLHTGALRVPLRAVG